MLHYAARNIQEMKWCCFRIVYAKLGQASEKNNNVILMIKHTPEWVHTSNPVIRSPARCIWTTEPASEYSRTRSMFIELELHSLTTGAIRNNK